jgi:hypothetical protein
MPGRDLLSKLADAGEEAISKLAKAPGGEQMVHAMHAMRERTDELQKRIRGLDELEARVAKLEKRLEAVEGPKRTPARRAAASSSGRKTASRTRRGTAKSAKSSTRATARGSKSSGNGGSSTGATGGSSPG